MRTCGLRNSEFPKVIIYFCLVVLSIPLAIAQTAPPATAYPVATAGASNAISSQPQTFLATQLALATEYQSLIALGATLDQVQAWQQQNVARITAQQKLAQTISSSQPAQQLAYITDVTVPVGASQNTEAFLTAQANLFNLRAQLHNQQLQSLGLVDENKLDAVFQQQNTAASQMQTQRAQAITAESEQQPQPLLPPLSIPPGASPQQQAFLILRDQLARDEIQVNNQNLSLSPSARQELLQQWRQQNVSRFRQLQALAQNLSSPTSNPEQ